MQRVIAVPWSPEQYVAEEAHDLIVPESVCPNCATPTTLRTDNNQSLYGIFGRSDSDIYAVGSSLGGFSLILHGQP